MGKPILKWAGGKSQLLPIIDGHLPIKIKNNEINIYVELFIGAGAVFFHLVKYSNIKKAYSSDLNYHHIKDGGFELRTKVTLN